MLPSRPCPTPTRSASGSRPSPTGPLHIGTARTALFNFLFARHVGGTFLFRLEDTDVARSTEAFERDIIDGLHWLGITWDEGPDAAGGGDVGPYAPYRQMLRLDSYKEAADRLLAADLAYPCFCTPERARRRPQGPGGGQAAAALRRPLRHADRRGARRARSPRAGRPPRSASGSGPGVVGWNDLIRDRIEIDTANLGGDFVIVRGDGTPLYHFTVVVDDAAMEISHVIRGEDHVSNTPKHILLFEALGHPIPVFGHLPLILNPDGTKMSKRKSQTAVDDYRAEGFIREGAGELLRLPRLEPRAPRRTSSSLDEIVERFDIDKVQKGGARFDRGRLEWLNGQWIRRLEPDDLVDRLRPFLQAAVDDGRIDAAARRRRGPGAPAGRPGAAADPRRDRRPRRVPVGRRPRRRPGAHRARSAGTRRRPATALARRPRDPRRATTP